MKPTLFPGQSEPERESNAWHVQALQDDNNGYVVKQVPGFIAAECPNKECAEHIRDCLNIIQSLADSLGVNAVELAQRMEEGGIMQRLISLVTDQSEQVTLLQMNRDDSKRRYLLKEWEEILSKLEGRQG